MTDDQLNTCLQAEYLHLQKTIEDFDARALTIKAWSVSFGFVAIAGAFATHARVAFLIAAGSALSFWILEILWKLFQTAHYDRGYAIEAHFRGETKIAHPFQLSSAWYVAWRRDRLRRIPRIARWPHVALPHAIVCVLGVALYVLAGAGVVKP